MTDEISTEHLESVENGIEGLMKAVARAQMLGEAARAETESSNRTAQVLSWVKVVEEAINKVREISKNVREITKTSLENAHKATTPAEWTVNETNEAAEVLIKESEQMLRQSEEIDKAAKNVVETFIRALRGGLSQFDEKGELAKKAAETAQKLATVAFDAAEISGRVSQEAIKTSIEASNEGISRAEEISIAAKKAVETSIRAAAEVNEVSTISTLTIKKAAEELTTKATEIVERATEAAVEVNEISSQAVREAAKTSIKAFQELVSQAETIQRQAIDFSEKSLIDCEVATNSKKAENEKDTESDNVYGGYLNEVITNAEKIEEVSVSEEIESRAKGKVEPSDIEARLEILAKMYKPERGNPEKSDASSSL